MAIIYTAHAIVKGGRDGYAETDDKNISIPLSRPGSNKPGTTNPEQLFACGYAACFGSAVEFVAKQQKIDLNPIEIKSDVTLNQDNTGFFIAATLNVLLPSLDRSVAEKLLKDAHQLCPYSKAIRNNITVNFKINDQEIHL